MKQWIIVGCIFLIGLAYTGYNYYTTKQKIQQNYESVIHAINKAEKIRIEFQVKEKLGSSALIDFASNFDGRFKVIAKTDGSNEYNQTYLIKVHEGNVVEWIDISLTK